MLSVACCLSLRFEGLVHYVKAENWTRCSDTKVLVELGRRRDVMLSCVVQNIIVRTSLCDGNKGFTLYLSSLGV